MHAEALIRANAKKGTFLFLPGAREVPGSRKEATERYTEESVSSLIIQTSPASNRSGVVGLADMCVIRVRAAIFVGKVVARGSL